MSDVNKQLLDAAKKVLEKLEGKSFVGNDLRDDLRETIAAAERAQQAEPVAWFYSDNVDKQDNLYRRTTVRDVAEGFARQGRRVIAQYDATQPPAVAVAVPEVWRDAMERAAEDLEDNNCLESAHQLRAMLAAAPQGAQPAQLPPYDSFSDDGGESWRDHPADCDFVDGMQLGEEFELLGGWKAKHLTFRVTKVPDDENDDYEVEEVTALAAAQKGGA